MLNSPTLSDFISQKGYLPALQSILLDIAKVSVRVQKTLLDAPLGGMLGGNAHVNVQGEDQQKLDAYADELFVQGLLQNTFLAGIGSEERDDLIQGAAQGEYIAFFDPLDGSSNIDVNGSLGTIFSVMPRTQTGTLQNEELLQKGENQVLAGYVLYGAATWLVCSFGKGVHTFVLHTQTDTYHLLHEALQSPKSGKIYSINEGNILDCETPVQDYVKNCQERRYTARYAGALVGDFHRNLLKGGIYLYPATEKSPKGKLRLLYEAFPLAYIAREAGATASNGTMPILDITATALHERTPLFIGSVEMMRDLGAHCAF